MPIGGQSEGGLSPTAANGRRLGETATVANTPTPTILTPPHPTPTHPTNHTTIQPTNQLTTQDAVLIALLCILWPLTSGSWSTASIACTCVCVCFFVCNCMRLQKVASCMYSQEGGRKTEGRGMLGVHVCGRWREEWSAALGGWGYPGAG